MSSIKAWLEEISEELGFRGEINDAVLKEGERRRDELYKEEAQQQEAGYKVCHGQMSLFGV